MTGPCGLVDGFFSVFTKPSREWLFPGGLEREASVFPTERLANHRLEMILKHAGSPMIVWQETSTTRLQQVGLSDRPVLDVGEALLPCLAKEGKSTGRHASPAVLSFDPRSARIRTTTRMVVPAMLVGRRGCSLVFAR